jgi:hypothetical protein
VLSTEGIERYAQEAEAAVYFYSLEALQNVSKYADATSATVRLWQEDGRLLLAVTDDGGGFDTTQTGYGTGLEGMADRLAALGGSLCRAWCDEHGSLSTVKVHTVINGFNLGAWLHARRQDKKHNRLSEDRITALEELGIVWDPSGGSHGRLPRLV